MRVLVCGSRTFQDRAHLEAVLHGLCYVYYGNWVFGEDDKEFIVIQGGARGADELADQWADSVRTEVLEFPADWDRYGKRAGYVRNQQMLDEGQPDLVVAFVDKPLPESRGTAMMVDIARKAGIKTIVVEVEPAPVKPWSVVKGI